MLASQVFALSIHVINSPTVGGRMIQGGSLLEVRVVLPRARPEPGICSYGTLSRRDCLPGEPRFPCARSPERSDTRWKSYSPDTHLSIRTDTQGHSLVKREANPKVQKKALLHKTETVKQTHMY